MIYQYHFDFKDESTLYSKPQQTVCGIVVVKEDPELKLDKLQSISGWMNSSGQEIQYLSQEVFSKNNHDFSWAMEIKDTLTLFWDSDKLEILYRKGQNYTPKRLEFWLYHTFFPISLELRNIYKTVHVGSIEIEGKPILFSAFSFGGKSTMTDYFIQKGHTMLSDDSLGIDKRGDTYYAIHSYPFHRPYR